MGTINFINNENQYIEEQVVQDEVVGEGDNCEDEIIVVAANLRW